MTATTVHEPTHREALWELEDAFERGDLITIFGRCTVEYDGLAAYSLGLGPRVLTLQPHRTAVVHPAGKKNPATRARARL